VAHEHRVEGLVREAGDARDDRVRIGQRIDFNARQEPGRDAAIDQAGVDVDQLLGVWERSGPIASRSRC
jgi:hypothetical protein